MACADDEDRKIFSEYEEIVSKHSTNKKKSSTLPPRILWEGSFLKQGSFVQNWKERYFTLFSNLDFLYYLKKESTKEKGSGSLKNVKRITAAPENVVCFETPKRTWRFVFKNVEQMDKWLG